MPAESIAEKKQMSDTTSSARTVVARFNEAWSRHDLDAALELITDDCVFDATAPAPDGVRHVGKSAVAAAWAPIFADQAARFAVDDVYVGPDHVVQQWTYRWGTGHVRGIDLIQIREGRICAKFSYVKG